MTESPAGTTQGSDEESSKLVGREFPGARPRDRLLAALRHELLGPESEDEVLAQPPGTRYLVGMLAPRGTRVDPVEDESIDAEQSDEATAEEPVRASASLDPSAIGISCVVDEGADAVDVIATWGEYEKVERATDAPPEEDSAVDPEGDPGATPRRGHTQFDWARKQRQEETSISAVATAETQSKELADGIWLEWTARRLGDALVISIFLLNGRPAPEGKRPPDELWLYQPRLMLRGPGEPFRPRSAAREHADPDPDIASADLIYRNRREFATGHGVAANWEASDDGDRARSVWTETIPDSNVRLVAPTGSGDGPALDMDVLAASDGSQLEALITPMLDAYEAWIDQREAEAGALPEIDEPVGADHVILARRSLTRMRAGLSALVANPPAHEAFRFANAAMAEQRRRTEMVLRARRGEPSPESIAAEWRPFQMGFILLCLPGLIDPFDDDREVADLLWFPTGGGKTEAYLGLTAFTLAYRRLSGADDAYDYSSGTAVLMRYTLRLLTIQQFGRALTLLCACEALREASPEKWGEERFTIGLWVGQSATPNNYEDAKDALGTLKAGTNVHERSPYQILFCPWCGTDIEPGDYVSDDDLERTLIKCHNPSCKFSAQEREFGLPALVVDEEIYRNPPSVLLATVDKFAQMAWNGRIQSLYGRVSRRCPRHGFLSSGESHPTSHKETPGFAAVTVEDVEKPLAPPDLIIQDELHLISGPLGTLVGIYETVVEGLCGREQDGKRVRPKIVASTATIRRANRQIEGLFARDSAVFPPLGLSAEDSFFARETWSEDRPGRLYVGVYAPGKSVKTALVRVYAALLSRALREYEAQPDAEADSYMTLVGYFNSLRELGGAIRLVEDDVPARLRVLQRRGFGPRRTIYEHEELTSRRQSSQIPAILKRLDRTFADRRQGEYPVDMLLASNMISVGVDIDRLGMMVVSAQPKTSAEYIQATSRVGRMHPGLVVEVYNWSRPRDTSHYERFRHYHETFYRHVEATSVTPFSSRARDRALRGVLTSYVRMDDPTMSAEAAAENFEPDSSSVERIFAELVTRAKTVTGRDDVAAETEQQLANLVAEWSHWADHEQDLVYAGRGLKKGDPRLILLRHLEQSSGRGIWPVAGSLREVEPEIAVVLRDGTLG